MGREKNQEADFAQVFEEEEEEEEEEELYSEDYSDDSDDDSEEYIEMISKDPIIQNSINNWSEKEKYLLQEALIKYGSSKRNRSLVASYIETKNAVEVGVYVTEMEKLVENLTLPTLKECEDMDRNENFMARMAQNVSNDLTITERERLEAFALLTKENAQLLLVDIIGFSSAHRTKIETSGFFNTDFLSSLLPKLNKDHFDTLQNSQKQEKKFLLNELKSQNTTDNRKKKREIAKRFKKKSDKLKNKTLKVNERYEESLKLKKDENPVLIKKNIFINSSKTTLLKSQNEMRFEHYAGPLNSTPELLYLMYISLKDFLTPIVQQTLDLQVKRKKLYPNSTTRVGYCEVEKIFHKHNIFSIYQDEKKYAKIKIENKNFKKNQKTKKKKLKSVFLEPSKNKPKKSKPISEETEEIPLINKKNKTPINTQNSSLDDSFLDLEQTVLTRKNSDEIENTSKKRSFSKITNTKEKPNQEKPPKKRKIE